MKKKNTTQKLDTKSELVHALVIFLVVACVALLTIHLFVDEKYTEQIKLDLNTKIGDFGNLLTGGAVSAPKVSVNGTLTDVNLDDTLVDEGPTTEETVPAVENEDPMRDVNGDQDLTNVDETLSTAVDENPSHPLSILATEVENVTLNSTFGTNSSAENLTLHYDLTNELAKGIINWYVDGSSITVLNLPFENNTADVSATTKDYSPYSNNGTVINAIWNATGGYDSMGAYEFDGDGDKINLSNGSSLDLEAFTLTTWIYKLDSESANIFDNYAYCAGEFDALRKGYIVGIDNNGFVSITLGNRTTTYYNYKSNQTVSLNTWQHIALVFNGSKVDYYINGNYVSSNNTVSINYSGLTGWDKYIGAVATCNDRGNEGGYFNGTIDEFQIWDNLLSAEQIQALYQNRTDLIVSQETVVGEIWNATVTPNDGTEDGTTKWSNSLTILNSVPVANNVILNSSLGTNLTSENLTLYWDATDADDEPIKNITNWFVDGSSITVLNMPFENNTADVSATTKDYSPYSNNASEINATWNSTAGYDGNGAYDFDGYNDYILLPGNNELTNVLQKKSDGWTWVGWIKSDSGDSVGFFFGVWDSGGSNDEIRFGITPSQIVLAYDDDSSGSASNCIIPGDYTGEWQFVSMSISNSNLSCYLNGDYINSTNVSSKGDLESLDIVTLGERITAGSPYHRAAGNADYFNGTIDDMAIYNRTLSAEQVQALYQNRTDLIVSQETVVGETWNATVTPNDGFEDGATVWSNTLEIENGVPTHDTPILNSTYSTNLTSENLTVYAQNVNDSDNDDVKLIYNWYVDDSSLAVLNMPFEGGSQSGTAGGVADGAKDYSGFGNNGTIYNATWSSTGGYDGKGAYEFDSNGYINLDDKPEWDVGDQISVSTWIKSSYTATSAKGLVVHDGSEYKWLLYLSGGVSEDFIGTYIRTTSGVTNAKCTYADGFITDGKWHHITGTYSKSLDGNRVKTYLDGVLCGVADGYDESILDGDEGVWIGRH